MINCAKKILSILNNKIWSSLNTIIHYCKEYGKSYSIITIKNTLNQLITSGRIEKRFGKKGKWVYRIKKHKSSICLISEILIPKARVNLIVTNDGNIGDANNEEEYL